MQLLTLFTLLIGAAVGPGKTPALPPNTPTAADYWARRKAVVLRLEWSDPDSIPDVRLLWSEAPQRAVDSLRSLATQIRWPDDIAPSVHHRWTEVVLFATDRTERAAWPTAEHLPGAVESALERGHPAAWLRAHAEVDAQVTLEDFVRYETRAIYRYPLADRYPGLLRSSQAQAKANFGILSPSPDERWVLDPFVGTEIYENGRMERDVDPGFQIYDARSGDCVYYDIGLMVDLCFWLDDRTFVLLGHQHVYPPGEGFGFVPGVWVGDVEAGLITAYLGALLPPVARRAFWQEALGPVYRAAYPRLRFEN